jgi:hypothetical protein
VVGQPVQRRSPILNRRTENVFRALDDLAEDPNTLLALKDLNRLLAVGRPLVEYVAPFQTVCNYWNYWWTGLGGHQSEPVRGGFAERVFVRSDNGEQDNRFSSPEGDRPADVPANRDPQRDRTERGDPFLVSHPQAYLPAIDARGNADCGIGQTGYMNGPLIPPGGRYPAADIEPGESRRSWEQRKGGGSHIIASPDVPGLSGGTYKSRELGIDNLRDVP